MKKLCSFLACVLVVASASVASAQSLTTLFAADNSGAPGGAVYFDLTVGPNDLTITGFDTNTDSVSPFLMEVYAVIGTYVGNEQNAGFWGASAGTASGTGAGQDIPSSASLGTGIDLTAGTTYAMALVLDATAGHFYTNGDGTNEAFSNLDMSLALGAASNTAFGAPTFSPRVWNGTVFYEPTAVIPEPASFSILVCSAIAAFARRRRS